jgi:hypothetical protein
MSDSHFVMGMGGFHNRTYSFIIEFIQTGFAYNRSILNDDFYVVGSRRNLLINE